MHSWFISLSSAMPLIATEAFDCPFPRGVVVVTVIADAIASAMPFA